MFYGISAITGHLMPYPVYYLFGFNGISTFVGYLMPNPFYTNKQFYFKQIQFIQTVQIQTIQFSISMVFVYPQ